MIAQLAEIYLPLVLWVCVGLVFLRSVPDFIPKLIGRSLYWIGVPLQVLAFMQKSEININLWVVPLIVILSLAGGATVAWFLSRDFTQSAERGDFLLAAILGNTGFVGLAITPNLIANSALSWVVLFSLAHNIIGSYGIGVAIASYYGEHSIKVNWTTHLKSVITTPSLWAFGLGLYLQINHIELNQTLGIYLQESITVVVPLALLLVGIRLKSINSWESLRHAIPATAIKLILLPLSVGVIMGMMGISGSERLSMVLQAGMPTALAGVILAEEYNLRRDTIILSIALSSIGVLLTIPLWLWLFQP
ncbi:putative permease [Synechococcus sp. PCC 7502]|uniref:AEC family transporter n=1 Tax=Synechococcus sp. PCC 7502 TaxID=1173263 RepID=UPI00029FECBB|nr:AEC family transporter [Synechococcus sp. PCC 7502]AFY74809.1 putative permease [Synechococcus sp. PCC 7502]